MKKIIYDTLSGKFEVEFKAGVDDLEVANIKPIDWADERAIPYLKERVEAFIKARTDEETEEAYSSSRMLGGVHAPWLAGIEIPEGAVS